MTDDPIKYTVLMGWGLGSSAAGGLTNPDISRGCCTNSSSAAASCGQPFRTPIAYSPRSSRCVLTATRNSSNSSPDERWKVLPTLEEMDDVPLWIGPTNLSSLLAWW